MSKHQKIIVWFRNDLRIHDHEALSKAIENAQSIVPVYIFDPRWFKITDLGFEKTGNLRTQFLLEAVQDLQNNLKKIGSELIIRTGKPEDILPQMAEKLGATAIYTSEEVTDEEIAVDSVIEKRLKAEGISMNFYWMSTLYHLDDLPFDIDKLPDVFTQFRNKTERFAKIRTSYPSPQKLAFTETIDLGQLPSLSELGFEQAESQDRKQALHFVGGETAALARLEHYFWESDSLKSYKITRNEMLGSNYSSKFSAWLALGCISPRKIYEEISRYETERTKNESTYWLIFELIWRDYFRFVAMKFGNKLFFQEGFMNDTRTEWQENRRIFDQWKLGQTGVPLIDANMQELLKTGFMSNRGRQNVASFLTKDLKINWLWGAAWFESQLLDYDVCSNYGNWQYVAGVGNDPRENRYFNIYTQATRYDQAGQYVKHWLPALKNIPAEMVHKVGLLSAQEQSKFGLRIGVDYPKAMINVGKWLKS